MTGRKIQLSLYLQQTLHHLVVDASECYDRWMAGRELQHNERVAIARLHALLELLPTALDKHMQAMGITAFEYSLLERLAETPSHVMRLSALAAKTNATLPRLSRVVSSLERKKLVARTPCAEDARATNAVLTLDGEAAFRRAKPVFADAVRAMVLDGLGDGEVDQLAALSFGILTKLDPDKKLGVTADGSQVAAVCDADPAAAEAAADDPICDADPVQQRA